MKTVGVSNFLPDDLQNLLADCRVKNQLLLHITSTDLPLLDFCRSHRILVGTYSPLPTAKPSRTPPFRKWRKNTAPPAQLCIRYALKLGAVALPKTANPAHMADNVRVDFSISSEGTEAPENHEAHRDLRRFRRLPGLQRQSSFLTLFP